MKYDQLKKRIARKYDAVELNGNIYFFDRKDGVVAVENAHRNLLTMYVRGNYGHYGIAAIAIAKDFVLTKNYKKQIADVVVISGLFGACNSFKRVSNRLLLTSSNLPIHTYKRNDDPEETLISPMGYISANKVDLDIKIEINVSPLIKGKPNFNFDNLIYGILCYKKPCKKGVIPKISPKDYDVFSYLRQCYSWYWTHGSNSCGSYAVREKICETRNGTNYHKIAKISCTTK